MKAIKISLHSFVDLITNSSSEVFVSSSDHTERMVKELIDKILKNAGTEKTCDELFNVSVTRGEIIINPKNSDGNGFTFDIEYAFNIEAEYNG